jgi:methylthioribose-1-phosphate isomerase
MRLPKTIEWTGESVRLLDQTRLPTEIVYRDCRTLEEVRAAICELAVRGAPAIGVSAAYALALWARTGTADGFAAAVERLRSSRPTAVNLFWALDRLSKIGFDPGKLLEEAQAIEAEDAAMCRAMGTHGASLIAENSGVLTHCNTGSLATAGLGTALAAIFVAHEQGKRPRVFADETRPLLQGARLTAWELVQAGVEVTVICDNMAAQVLREGRVQLVIVGADRITANGDAANKIGTYGLAIVAKYHGVPFYVAAPSSTFDLTLADGSAIPIEQRNPKEVTHGFGRQTVPEGAGVYNPAFDVTPADLITGIITERGIITPVKRETIAAMLEQGEK